MTTRCHSLSLDVSLVCLLINDLKMFNHSAIRKMQQNFKTKYVPLLYTCIRCDAQFVQFKRREKHPWRSVTFSTVTLLKVSLLHVCLSRFLNRTNGTKSRKASLIYTFIYKHLPLHISCCSCFCISP